MLNVIRAGVTISVVSYDSVVVSIIVVWSMIVVVCNWDIVWSIVILSLVISCVVSTSVKLCDGSLVDRNSVLSSIDVSCVSTGVVFS